MVRLLHFSDIHLGSGLGHGKLNPVTGLNTRLEDFTLALGRCIDAAITQAVDLVLFGGDAFPDATPAPYLQEIFAQQFRRLVDAAIPTVLLVGNHDQHSQGQGGTSLCIYRTLGVPGMTVGDRLETHRIPTHSGPVQVITLPWLTRSALLTRPDTEGLSMAEVSHLLLDRLRLALEGEIRQLDPTLPTVLLAHAMLDTATYGAERFLAVGKGFTLPLSLVARDCFDYVALGHVHRHQNLGGSGGALPNGPPIVYPGSIERVDFSEEKEPKGYVLVELERGRADVCFHPLPVRPFQTLRLDLTRIELLQSDPAGLDPTGLDPTNPLQAYLLQTLQRSLQPDAVVRLLCQLRPDQLSQIDEAALHAALNPAHTYTVQLELTSQLATPRLPELSADQGLDPLAALQTYLNHRPDLAPLQADLLQVAQALLTDHETTYSEQADPLPQSPSPSLTAEAEGTYNPNPTQLRLL